jgi:serine/threonine protein kinase
MENICTRDQQLGHYRLERMLRQTKLANVYLGRHVQQQTPMAVKCLHGRYIGNAASDFLRQYTILAHLQHPNILKIIDFGIFNDTAFVVTPYAPKGTLRQHLPKGTRIDICKAVDYIQQLSSALAYVHRQGLVHRDLKPQNILIGEQNQLLLADFGTAIESYSLHRGQSYLQEFEGTIIYAAPEQLQGKPRRSSDQYALAVMTYEWLTGHWPFSGTFYEIAHQHLFVDPPTMTTEDYFCLPNVEQVIFKALAKVPAQRFKTIEQFADEFSWACKIAQARGLLPSKGSTIQSPISLPITPIPETLPHIQWHTEPRHITVNNRPHTIPHQFKSPFPGTLSR